MTRSRTITTVLIAALTLSIGGCAKWSESGQDAPRTGTRNTEPVDIINMPDGFSNVAVKCEGPNRVYVAFHGDGDGVSIAVVANDPRCAAAAK